jgi:hypothetical protein
MPFTITCNGNGRDGAAPARRIALGAGQRSKTRAERPRKCNCGHQSENEPPPRRQSARAVSQTATCRVLSRRHAAKRGHRTPALGMPGQRTFLWGQNPSREGSLISVQLIAVPDQRPEGGQ